MSRIMTVTGWVDSDLIQDTYVHEHLYTTATPSVLAENPLMALTDLEKIEVDLALFKQAGGNCIAEMTTIDYGSIWFLAFNDSGAAGKRFENALKIDFGLAMSMTGIFKYDKSASGLEYFKQVINGISGGEIFQSTFGNGFAHYENVCGNIDEIGYYEGRTIVRVKEDSFNKYSGVSHGYYVFGENIALNPQDKEHDVDLSTEAMQFKFFVGLDDKVEC